MTKAEDALEKQNDCTLSEPNTGKCGIALKHVPQSPVGVGEVCVVKVSILTLS